LKRNKIQQGELEKDLWGVVAVEAGGRSIRRHDLETRGRKSHRKGGVPGGYEGLKGRGRRGERTEKDWSLQGNPKAPWRPPVIGKG